MTTKPAIADPNFFPGFRLLNVEIEGVRFSGVVGGEGSPVLLLHGYPQTHIAWRRIAPELARSHLVIIPDLPGYGASILADPYAGWTKRRVGTALSALMAAMGVEHFAVVGHDRGARAGYRLALDRPELVSSLTSLAVVPTLDAMAAVDWREAAAKFHWFLLSRPAPLPELLLTGDPAAFLESALNGMTEGRGFLEEPARRAYHQAFLRTSVRIAICEDYRAALGEDLALDRADRLSGHRLACPVLSLSPSLSGGSGGEEQLEVWRRWATDVIGGLTSGGHLMPEEVPDEVLAYLLPFLADTASRE